MNRKTDVKSCHHPRVVHIHVTIYLDIILRAVAVFLREKHGDEKKKIGD